MRVYTSKLTPDSAVTYLCVASYFDLVFVKVCSISRRESSGYTFAITAQM